MNKNVIMSRNQSDTIVLLISLHVQKKKKMEVKRTGKEGENKTRGE